jgi:hypothetical protein
VFALFFCDNFMSKIPYVLEEPPCVGLGASLCFCMIFPLGSFSPMAVVLEIYPPCNFKDLVYCVSFSPVVVLPVNYLCCVVV